MSPVRAVKTLARLAFAGLLAGLLSSCVSFGWVRQNRHAPLPRGAIEGLEPGRTTLAESLERLGAPLHVWEYKGDGAALAWGWSDSDEKGLSLSVPLYEQLSASFSYDAGRENLRGAVLLFDRSLVLESVRLGRLRDLERQIGRRRPAQASDQGP